VDLIFLKSFLTSLSLPDYRNRQIVKNYFSGKYLSFDEMTDLPKDLRELLKTKLSLYSVQLKNILTDNFSSKALLRLKDNKTIETVLMKYDSWNTVCVSSQVGCPLNCAFCATGKMGFSRNLTAEEIIDQIIFWKNKEIVSRVVFMGMGEPFLNWDNLIASLKIINDPNYLNIGNRKISISTAGIAPKIIDFATLDTEINLAVSLHSASQSRREEIMPIAKEYSLTDLKKALSYYLNKTRRQVMIEYALIDDFNDRLEDIELLKKFFSGLPLIHLNIIPLNFVSDGLTPSTHLKSFTEMLSRSNIEFTLRRSIGSDINSACGQLSSVQ
jgi:23S rRNA (adenine2503-C2)-methyltransferase